jgi:hypothetical protein
MSNVAGCTPPPESTYSSLESKPVKESDEASLHGKATTTTIRSAAAMIERDEKSTLSIARTGIAKGEARLVGTLRSSRSSKDVKCISVCRIEESREPLRHDSAALSAAHDSPFEHSLVLF